MIEKYFLKKGTTFWGRKVAQVQDKHYSKTKADIIEEQLNSYRRFLENYKTFKQNCEQEVKSGKNSNYKYCEYRIRLDLMKKQDLSKMSDEEMDAHINSLVLAETELNGLFLREVEEEMNIQIYNYLSNNYKDVAAISELSALRKEIKTCSRYYNNMSFTSSKELKSIVEFATQEFALLDLNSDTKIARANREYAKNMRGIPKFTK